MKCFALSGEKRRGKQLFGWRHVSRLARSWAAACIWAARSGNESCSGGNEGKFHGSMSLVFIENLK
jgi:hypothetical protein